jgi:7-carboxy-7-deazaguanine synthase
VFRVSETFLSLQGESTYAGELCFFIRLSGCNLDCRYCDTRFSRASDAGSDMSLSSLVALAKESGAPLVEITGGEPLLQDDTPELCQELLNQGLKVLVETNGSLPVDILAPEVICIIDCKTPSSGHARDNFLPNFNDAPANAQIKFVISDQADYDFACEFIQKYALTRKVDEILFSPMTAELSPQTLAEWMIRDRFPARLQLQLHKYIWPPEARGV